jgi:sulfatase modifying factor 1
VYIRILSRQHYNKVAIMPLLLLALFGNRILSGCSGGCGRNEYHSANIGTLKYVPAGTFHRDDTAENTSMVSAFHMSQYEITQAQYMAVTGADNPSWNVERQVKINNTNRPVDSVTWYDAVEFCNKLSTLEGLTPVYTITNRNPPSGYPIKSATVTMNMANNGYRLPTEAEWQWAAMGATDSRKKAFAGSTGSNAIGDYTWYEWNAHLPKVSEAVNYGTHEVGTKKPNELGLYDMSGNVWEWCWDWYDTYPTGPVTNYEGAASGTDHVFRGGGWSREAFAATVAYRATRPYAQGYDIGFRVVRR